MKKWYIFAAAVRFFLILYGEWQDRAMNVKFTDIDYYVFTDAAKFVSQVFCIISYTFSVVFNYKDVIQYYA